MTDGVPQWEVSNSSPSVLGEAVLLGGDDQVYFAWLAFPGTCFFPLSLSPASGHCICHLRTFQGEEEGSSSCPKQRLESNLPCLGGKVESVSPGLGANSPSPCKDLRQGWCSACDSSTQHSVPFSHTGPQTLLLVLLSYHMAACLGSTHDTHPTFRPQRVLSVMFCSAMEFWSGRFCSSWEAILGGECSIVPCDPPCTTCQAQWVSLDHLIQKCPPRWNYASSRFLF